MSRNCKSHIEEKRFESWLRLLIPMTRFASRWHPFAIDPNHDYSKEQMTLVMFELSDVRMVESC